MDFFDRRRFRTVLAERAAPSMHSRVRNAGCIRPFPGIILRRKLRAPHRPARPDTKRRVPKRERMEISATLLDDVAAVAVKGRLDSSNADGLKERLSEIIHSGSSRLVIDLQDVIYISSAGFRTLLITARAVDKASGSMVLCGIAGEVKRLFDVAAFGELFTIVPTRDDALRALGGGPRD
jgi:anti-anti-sigma factor